MADSRIQIKDLPQVSSASDDDLLMLQTGNTNVNRSITKKNLIGEVLTSEKLATEIDNLKTDFVTKTNFDDHINNTDNPHSTKFTDLLDVESTIITKDYVVVGGDNNKLIMKQLDLNSINSKADDEGKIKLTNTSDLDYLGNLIDSNTIEINGNRLIIKSLDGLQATIAELNCLQGMTDNIKETLANLSTSGMNYTGTIATKADLDALTGMIAGNTKIVLQDETNSDKRITYIYNGTSWEALGEFNIEIRDFNINPIDLETETTGKLPNNKLSIDIDDYITNDILNNKIDSIFYNDTFNSDLSDANYGISFFDYDAKGNPFDSYGSVITIGSKEDKQQLALPWLNDNLTGLKYRICNSYGWKEWYSISMTKNTINNSKKSETITFKNDMGECYYFIKNGFCTVEFKNIKGDSANIELAETSDLPYPILQRDARLENDGETVGTIFVSDNGKITCHKINSKLGFGTMIYQIDESKY